MFMSMWRRAIATSLSTPRRGSASAARKRQRGRRLTLESLESRTLLSFLAPVNYHTGGPPLVVVPVDLNGDGKLDLVTANSTGTVSVLLGNGDGSFRAPRDYVASDGSVDDVAVGDFTGDGKLDLVTANAGATAGDPGDMSLLLGNGDGTFQPAIHFSPGIGPKRVAPADFNNDGHLDLVVGFSPALGVSSSSVAVLLGNGDGTFRTAWTYVTGANSFPQLAVADFNGDGNLDLAVSTGSVNGSVNVFAGNGDGTFQGPQTYAVGSFPLGVAAGDLNGDGILDLVVVNSAMYTGTPSLSVLLGNGDGSFQAAQNYAVGKDPDSLALGDFNGDGRADVVVTNDGSGTVSVLLGNGDGTFQARQTYNVGLQPSSVAAVDVNGDGALDLVVADSYSGDNVTVLLGNGDGTFPVLPKYDTGLGIPAGHMVTGDFNGDGIPDLALATSNTVSVLLGNGDGTFQAPRTSSFNGYGVTSLAVGDFDGDGQLDLAVAFSGDFSHHPVGVAVLLGNGDGTFHSSFTYTGSGTPGGPASSVAVADFNGDNQPDLVVSNLDAPGSVSVLMGNGDGTFQTPQDYLLGSLYVTVAVADLNKDGRPDIVTANTSYSAQLSVSVLLGNGDGSFQPPQTILSQPTNYLYPSLAIGDLNGDGTPDLVVGSGSVFVLLGNGDGTFQPANNAFSGTLGNIVTSLAIADFNQDGVPDLAVGFAGGNGPAGVGVLLGNGDGSFQPTSLSYGAGASVGTVADVNGDGFPDVVTPNLNSSTVSVLVNAADWPSGPAFSSSGPSHSPTPRPLGSVGPWEFSTAKQLQETNPASAGSVQPGLTVAETDRLVGAAMEESHGLALSPPETARGKGKHGQPAELAPIDSALFMGSFREDS
jgi:hypothetical protein